MDKLDDDLLQAGRDSPPPTSTGPSDTPQATTKPSRKLAGGEFPDRCHDYSFDNFDVNRNAGMAVAVQQCQAVASGEAWCAFLQGDYGVGKTHLLFATIWGFHGEYASFWKVPEFLAFLRSLVRDEPATLDSVIENHRRSKGLIALDDYGAHNSTEWVEEQLYRVLDWRSEEQLPTIITANVPLESIDGRIRSRFRCGLVICRGKDQRLGTGS